MSDQQLAKPAGIHPTIALLMKPSTKDELALVTPKGVDLDAIISRARLAVMSKPDILNCTAASILMSVKKSVMSGLDLDGRNAHLVPFGKECTFLVDYKGYIALAKRSGIPLVFAEIVCENDTFRLHTDDQGRHMMHEIDIRKPRGPVLGVYSYAKDKDGFVDVEYMSLEEVNAIKARSRASHSGPWKTDENEMRKKTVIRRHSKRWDISPQFRDALEADDDTIDIEAIPVNQPVAPKFADQLTGGPKKPRGTRTQEPPPVDPPSDPGPSDPPVDDNAAPGGPDPAPDPAPVKVDPHKRLKELLAKDSIKEQEFLDWLKVKNFGVFSNVHAVPAARVNSVLEEWESVSEEIRGA